MKNMLKFLKKNKTLLILIGIASLFFHVIFFQSINSIMILPVLFYWALLGIVYKLHEKFFFSIAIFFLILSVPPFLFGYLGLAEKLAVWEFLFLILGLFQWLFLELPFVNNKK